MDFWSKGLGRRSLVMDLGREGVECDGEQLLLSGVVTEPVTWEYIMYLPPKDWHEFFFTALRPQCATYLLDHSRMRSLLRLMWFVARFIPLYLLAIMRVILCFAPPLETAVTVAPDLSSKAEIDDNVPSDG